MTTPVQKPAPTPQTARLIHGAMVIGVIIFAVVAHFLLVPKADPTGPLAAHIPLFVGLSLAGCVVGILVSYRIPRASSGASGQSFWTTAGPRAMICWALLEGSALLAVVVYSLTASRAEIAVAMLIIVVFALLNPGYFEKRN